MAARYLVPYYRVSTDNKGQDAARQKLSCEPWAEREGFHLLAAEEEEESASKVPALVRPKFVAACERARAARAEGVIMEGPDRFSREEPDLAIWQKVEVERRYGVRLYFAAMPLEMQLSTWGKVGLFIMQTSANVWVEEHRKKIITGNARARARGVRLGRKPKAIPFEEVALIDGWRADGFGWESIANKLNQHRGVFELTDKKVARRRSISASALKRWDRARKAEVESPAESQNGAGTSGPDQGGTPLDGSEAFLGGGQS